MGSHYRVLPFRRFAFGSPAVIESSPPMGAQALRYAAHAGPMTFPRRTRRPPPESGFSGPRGCAISKRWRGRWLRGENGNMLIMNALSPTALCGEATGRGFCHYMSQIHGIFPSETPHGTVEASHGSAFPWDVSTERPHIGARRGPATRRKGRGDVSLFFGKARACRGAVTAAEGGVLRPRAGAVSPLSGAAGGGVTGC